MIVLDHPTLYEATSLTVGTTMRWFIRQLSIAGIDISTCYITYAVKCATEQVKSSHIKACKKYLLQDLADVNPEQVLLVGATPVHALLGKRSLSKIRGDVIEQDGIKYMAIAHPSVALRAPEEASTFFADLHYFARVMEGTYDDMVDFKWRVVNDSDGYTALNKALMDSDSVAYDIETTSLKDTDNGKMLCIGFATDHEVFVVPLEVDEENVINSARGRLFLIEKYFLAMRTAGVVTVAQNAKFDNRWLRSRGINPHVDFDTYIASYLLNNTLPHGLKYMAKVEFGAPTYNEGISFDETIPFAKLAEYCAKDCYYTRKLYYRLKERMNLYVPA